MIVSSVITYGLSAGSCGGSPWDRTFHPGRHLRIIDESGEDYLYPETYFVIGPLARRTDATPLSFRHRPGPNCRRRRMTSRKPPPTATISTSVIRPTISKLTLDYALCSRSRQRDWAHGATRLPARARAATAVPKGLRGLSRLDEIGTVPPMSLAAGSEATLMEADVACQAYLSPIETERKVGLPAEAPIDSQGSEGWRKCVGIEPTVPGINRGPSDLKSEEATRPQSLPAAAILLHVRADAGAKALQCLADSADEAP